MHDSSTGPGSATRSVACHPFTCDSDPIASSLHNFMDRPITSVELRTAGEEWFLDVYVSHNTSIFWADDHSGFDKNFDRQSALCPCAATKRGRFNEQILTNSKNSNLLPTFAHLDSEHTRTKSKSGCQPRPTQRYPKNGHNNAQANHNDVSRILVILEPLYT